MSNEFKIGNAPGSSDKFLFQKLLRLKDNKILIAFSVAPENEINYFIKGIIINTDSINLTHATFTNSSTIENCLIHKLANICDTKSGFMFLFYGLVNNKYNLYALPYSYDINNILKEGTHFKINNAESLLLNSADTHEIPYADCNLLPNENLLITWHSELNKSHAKLYNSDLTVKKDDFLISGLANSNSKVLFPGIKIDSKNSKILIFFQTNNYRNFEKYDIAYSIYNYEMSLIKQESTISQFDNLNFSYLMPKISSNHENEFILCAHTATNPKKILCVYLNSLGNSLLETYFQGSSLPLIDSQEFPHLITLENFENILIYQADNAGNYKDIFVNNFYLRQILNKRIINSRRKSHIKSLETLENPLVNSSNYSANGFVVVYECENCDESLSGISLQFFDKNFNKINNEIIVNDTSHNIQDSPKIANFSNGQILIVWRGDNKLHHDNNINAIYGKVFNKDFTLKFSEFPISDNISQNKSHPDLVVDKEKNLFIIIFTSSYFVSNENFGPIRNGIFGKILLNDLTTVKNEFIINENLTENKSQGKICEIGKSLFLILWQSLGQENANYFSVYGRVINSYGNFLTKEFLVESSGIINNQISPTCGQVSENKFVVAYTKNQNIYAKIYSYSISSNINSSDNDLVFTYAVYKDNFLISPSANEQRNPVIESLIQGGFIIGWENLSNNNQFSDIYYSHFNKEVFQISINTIINANNKVNLLNNFTFGDQSELSLTQVKQTNEIVATFSSVIGHKQKSAIFFEFILNCPYRKFLNPKMNQVCSDCDNNCLFCSNNPQNCKCANGEFPAFSEEFNTIKCKNNSSISLFFEDKISNVYKKCDISCNNCIGKSDFCITCNENENFYKKIDEENKCLKSSSEIFGYFFNKNLKIFDKCDKSCLTCKDSKFFCVTCNREKLYYFLEDNSNKCVYYTEKIDGYYFDQRKNIFAKCEKKCLTCIDEFKCLTCNSLNGYYAKENLKNNCFTVNEMEENEYLDKSTSEYFIRKCDEKCGVCLNKKDNCLLCNNEKGYFYISDDTAKISKYLFFYFIYLFGRLHKKN